MSFKNVSDDRLLRREFYNANKFPVTFRIDPTQMAYVTQNGISVGQHIIRVAPGERAVLNHGFYIAEFSKAQGEAIAAWYFGKEIGTFKKPNRADMRKV